MRQLPSGDCQLDARDDPANGGSGGRVAGPGGAPLLCGTGSSGVGGSECRTCGGTPVPVAARPRLVAGTGGGLDLTAAPAGRADGGRGSAPAVEPGAPPVDGAVAVVTTGTPAHWADGPPRGPPWPRPLEAEDVVVEMVEGAAARRRERSTIAPGRGVNVWASAPGEGAAFVRRGTTTLPPSVLAAVPTGRPRGLLASAAGAAVGVVADAAGDAASAGGGRAAGTGGEAAWGRVSHKWVTLADIGLLVICGERERQFHSRHVLTSVQADEVGAWLVEAVPLAALQRISAALMHEADAAAADVLASGGVPATPGRRPSRLQAALDQRIMMVAEATGKRAMAEAEADVGGPSPTAAVPLADARRGGPVDWEAAVRDATMRARPADRRGRGGGDGGRCGSSNDGRRSLAKPRRTLAELLAERVTLEETLSRFEAQLESFDGVDGEELAEMLRPAMRELAEQLRLLNAQVVAAGGDASGRGGGVAAEQRGSRASVAGGGSSRASSSSRGGRPHSTAGSSAPSTRRGDDGDASTDGRGRCSDAASMGSAGSDGSGGLVVVVGPSASDSGGLGTFQGDMDAFFTDDSGSDSDRDYSLATSIHDGSVGRACDVPPAASPLSYDTSSSDDGGGHRPVAPPRRRRPSASGDASGGGGGGGNDGGEPPPMSPLTPEGALYSDFETAPSAALSLLDDTDAGVSSDLEVRTEEARRNRRRRMAAPLDQ